MKSLSLARILPVLDGPSHVAAEAARPDLHLVARNEFPVTHAFELPESEEPSTDMWQQGYEAGLAAARAEIAEIAAARDAQASGDIEQARAFWVAEESERIAQGVEKALALIEREISIGAERIFAQIAEASLRQRMLDQFAQAVEALLRHGEAGVVTVHAHHDLADALARRLEHVPALEIVPHDGAEVWVRAGQTHIETRFAAFAEQFSLGD